MAAQQMGSGGADVAGGAVSSGLSVDAELCARLGRALDGAMADGDYGYVDSARGLVVGLIQDTELRLRVRAEIPIAMQRGDLALVRSLCAALEDCEAGWVAWREKALALLEPSAS